MKRLIYLSIFMALMAGLASCQRDLLPDVVDKVEHTHDLPIQIVATIGDANIEGEEPATRSVEKAKKDFIYTDTENGTVGDVIHVQSEFLEADKKTVIETRYTALQYVEEGKWEPMGNGRFAWPDKAEYGRFTAYYIHGSTGALTDYFNENDPDNDSTATLQKFSDLVDGTDPLKSVTEELYGHTVSLKFEHMLTHLTVIELDAGVEDELIFRVDQDAAKMNKGALNNAFEITLDQKTNKINIEYKAVYESLKNEPAGGGQTTEEPEDDNQTGSGDGSTDQPSGSGYAALIKSQTVLVRDPVTRKESRQVGFFLEPGRIYDAFSILFSNRDPYLNYTNSSSADKRGQLLMANNRYTFNVKKSAGVTMATKPDQNWDEDDENFTVVVDAEAFLHAVNTNSDYSEYDDEKEMWVHILEATTDPSGTLLKCNVKFKEPYYHVFSYPDGKTNPDGTKTEPYEFVPTVGADNIFDGGYHYIDGMCCPLFYENSGTIKNLGLSHVTIGNEKYGNWISNLKYKDKETFKEYEYNRTGAIVTKNNGYLQNIRVRDLEINVELYENGNQETHNVGALIGVNDVSGHVESIHLSGKIAINTVKTTGKEATVVIGGLAGQNGGTIMDVGQLVDNRPEIKEGHIQPVEICINNSLVDDNGRYDIGGFVGINTGKLSGINIPTAGADGAAVTIDSHNSKGTISYIGGIVGTADTSLGNEISSCLVGSGKVMAGTSNSHDPIIANSYTGGIAGQINESVNVSNCTVFCSVTGATNPSEKKFGTGGVFGKIIAFAATNSVTEIGEMTSIAAFGDTLAGSNAGCFAGEVDGTTNRDWDYYKERVDVRTFSGYPYIANPERR